LTEYNVDKSHLSSYAKFGLIESGFMTEKGKDSETAKH